LILKKLRGLSAKCWKLEFTGVVFLKENPWTKSDHAGVAGPRFHRGLHGGRWPGLVGARPSGRSGPRRLAARVVTGRARLGATGGPLTGARATARRRRTGDEASAPSAHGVGTVDEGRRRGEGVRCSTGVRVPFYRVGRGAGRPGMAGGGGNWCLHGCRYRSEGGVSYGRLKRGRPLQLHGAEGGAASMARRRRERRRRRCRLGEGGRKGKGGMAWWAGSACLAARGQKGRMGRLATRPIGPKVEENSFLNIIRLWKFA
jgi:hypothetical protein